MAHWKIATRALFVLLAGVLCCVPFASKADSLARSGMSWQYGLAVRALASGDSEWAEWHYRNVLLYAELAGVRDEQVATSCYEVAMIRLDRADLPEAHRMMRRAYRTRRMLLGPAHPEVERAGRMLITIEARLAEAQQARLDARAASSGRSIELSSR